MASIQNLSLTLRAKLFRGLADPSRLAIVEALRAGEKTVSELVAITRLSQPNASAHLACLKDCGLVESRQERKFVFYALCDARMEALMISAEGIIAGVAENITHCSNFECQSEKRCLSSKQCISPAPDTHRSSKHTTVKILLNEVSSRGKQ